jgi:uncharacterized protein YabE (DUF348 family)
LLVNGAARQARALAFTSGQLVRAAGYSLQPADEIFPSPRKINLTHRTVVLNQAREVTIHYGAEEKTIISAGALPANLLLEAGLPLFPEDLLFWDDRLLSPNEPLPLGEALQLKFVPAKRVDLQFETETLTIFTQQKTLEEALNEAGISLRPEDALSQPWTRFISNKHHQRSPRKRD